MVTSNRCINLSNAQDDNYIDSLIKAHPEDEMMIRKAQEMVTRKKSRNIINDYLCEEVKEEVSNSLLKDRHSLGKDEGLYTEAQINWQNKRRDAQLNDEHISRRVEENLAGIRWSSIRIVLQKSHCNNRAVECLELSLQGYTYQQISEKKHMVDKSGNQLSASTVCRDVKCAIDVLKSNNTLGLVEVLCEIFKLPRDTVIDILKNN